MAYSTTALLLPPVLLALWIVRNLRVRYARFYENEARYGPRYALTAAEAAATGKPRMLHAGLKGIRDAQRIIRVPFFYDLPFLSTTSLQFALFKTYGVPSISRLLLATGNFSQPDKADRRYADTVILIGAFVLFPLGADGLAGTDVPEPGDELVSAAYMADASGAGGTWADPRSAIALARTNYLHRRWGAKISNGDLLYTLSLFILEPPLWAARFEWRAFSALEEEALFCTWYHIGRGMGITGIPDTIDGVRAWAQEYEAQHMVYADSNRAVGQYTVDLLLYHAPLWLRPALSRVVYSLLDTRLRDSFGWPRQPGWLLTAVGALLKTRAWVVRLLLPPRARPLCHAPPDSAQRILAGRGPTSGGAFCPASGVSAADAEKQGRQCPVGSHGAAPMTAASGKDDVLSLTRMQPYRIDNAPWYTAPLVPWTVGWALERLFVRAADRRGATRWQNDVLRTQGGAGFRLEECVSLVHPTVRSLELIGAAGTRRAGAIRAQRGPRGGGQDPRPSARGCVELPVGDCSVQVK
jgi:hypothetical protein